MNDIIWIFRTRSFTIVYEEDEAHFLDPLVHSPEIINAFNSRALCVTHGRASVYWRDNEVGRASMRDCIHPFEDDGYTVIVDRSYRFSAVRRAIGDTRQTLAKLQRDLPSLHLRSPP